MDRTRDEAVPSEGSAACANYDSHSVKNQVEPYGSIPVVKGLMSKKNLSQIF